jgi:hypothetical protein
MKKLKHKRVKETPKTVKKAAHISVSTEPRCTVLTVNGAPQTLSASIQELPGHSSCVTVIHAWCLRFLCLHT